MIKTKLIFADDMADYFGSCGLRSFDDFYYYGADLKILSESKRYANRISLTGEGCERSFFIKRFSHCHIDDVILSLRNFGRIYSQARCEYENANYLLSNGIGTYRPVCYGQEAILGIERRSFVITEELAGCGLDRFVGENFGRMRQDEKDELVMELGRFIRKVHGLGVGLTDLYIWHIFVKDCGDGRYKFSVIDLHRMKYNVGPAERIKNLARLHHSLQDGYFDDRLRRLLIDSYAKDNGQDSTEHLYRKIERLSMKLSKRRGPKPYTSEQDVSIQ